VRALAEGEKPVTRARHATLSVRPSDGYDNLQLAARTEWGTWLSRFQWDHFVTFTFDHQPSAASAKRQFARWLSRLEQRTQRELSWFCVIERSPAGLVHVHALVGGTAGLSLAVLRALWRGHSAVRRYDSRKAGAYYVTKCVGSSVDDYDLNLVAQGVK